MGFLKNKIYFIWLPWGFIEGRFLTENDLHASEQTPVSLSYKRKKKSLRKNVGSNSEKRNKLTVR